MNDTAPLEISTRKTLPTIQDFQWGFKQYQTPYTEQAVAIVSK